MSKDYWHCEKCNGNFDHGEHCDCKENSIYSDTPGPMLKVSETFILGIDISAGKDISCVQVTRQFGNGKEIINTFYGEEAEWTYNHLLNNKHHKLERV